MSWNHCSISGNILEDPVVSKKSGHIYEKKLIEKYIESTGNCPITNQPLSNEDLVPLKFNKTIQPRPVNATSIPNMIQIFQNEWDSVMLEVYTLKQHLEAVRQELSHALYQHDAACRVIARLIKERDESRQQLSSLMETVKNSSEIEIENGDKSFILPEPMIKQIQDTHDSLFSMRKERKKKENVWADYSTLESISQYSTRVSVPIHSSTKPGITALDINPDTDRYVITGGNDSHVIIYDQQESKIVCDFEKHNKKINEVAFIHRSDILRAVSCSEDHKANVFSFNPEDKSITLDYTVNDHTDGVTGFAIHPIQTLLAVASRDSSITIHDIALGKLLNKIDSEKNSPYHSLKIHPDGTLLFAGTSSGVVKIWNIVDGSLVTTVNAHQTEVDRIKFSENGFHFATGSTAENVVKIWDLRKMTNFKTFLEGQDFKLGDFTFDLSAQFFAIAGSSILLYETKNWNNFTKISSHQDLVTSIRFGKFSKSLISGSLDRHLNFHS